MSPRSGHRALRVLPLGPHLLLLGLLLLVAARAATVDDAGAAVVVLAVALAAVSLAGLVVPAVRRSRAWLAVLWVGWAGLVVGTADGVWVAFPLLFLLLLLLPPRVGLAAVGATTVVAIAGFAVRQDHFAPMSALGPIIGAAVAVATVRGYEALSRESEARRRLIEQLEATRSRLEAAGHAAGVAAERERLAREIHDTLAQGLSSIHLLLQAAEQQLPADPATAAAREHVGQAREIAQANLAEARRFVHALTPPELVGGSLPAAIERVCAAAGRQTATEVSFRLSGVPEALPTPHEVALLRIVQSALANALQHAQASHVAVTLSYMDDGVALDIVDDGVGFDATATPDPGSDRGFGLAAMRSRVRQLGGDLDVETAPGHGTALAVSFLPSRPETEAP